MDQENVEQSSELIPLSGLDNDQKLDPRKVNFRKVAVAASTYAKITNPIFEPHQVAYLQKRTPVDHIYERPGKGGGKWYYITSAFVIKSLNIIFGFNWSFEIKSFDLKGKQVLVHGRLTGTITKDGKEHTIWRESFGRADVKLWTKGADTGKPVDLGNDLKAAESDCLKRCYRQLGGALDVFATNEYAEIIFTDVPEDQSPDAKTTKIKEQSEDAKRQLLDQREQEKGAQSE